MHTYEKNNYPDILQKIKLSSTDIKNIVSTYRLYFLNIKEQEVEWGIKLPMFEDAFYHYVLNTQSIPNQDDFYKFYIDYNKDYFSKLNRPDLELGIKARVYRSYPSLIRDLYFNKFIKERLGQRCDIIYNTSLDIEEGIDLMIITKKGMYGICFFTKTRRAFLGRKVKINRHTLFENIKYIEVPLDFKGSVKAGDFFLYGEKEYNELFNILSK